jgi:hypothetical protein
MNRTPMISRTDQSSARPAAEPPRTAAGRVPNTDRTQEAPPMNNSVPRGPGLFEIVRANGERAVTNVRRLAGAEREPRPGRGLINTATVLLGLLGAGLFAVSLAAQYRYIFAAKHQAAAAGVEALAWDVAMVVFSLLALGLARDGKPARTERMLILACALGSAGMNYAAADVASPRSVAAYVVPPILLAIVVDRVIAVVRRHMLGDSERSPWIVAGQAALAVTVLAARVALYMLRLILAPASTSTGLRRWVLIATPLPAPPQRPQLPPADGQGGDEDNGDTGDDDEDPDDDPEPPATASKKTRFAWHYRRHPDYGDRAKAARAAAALAPKVGLSPGTARAYAYEILSEAS